VKKKIYLIGLNLYSIILSLKIKKEFKNTDITILEASKNFLNAYSGLKIGRFICNPGFHSLEDIRSDDLTNFLHKDVKLKTKKIRKTRGLLIGEHLISYTSNYFNWPNQIKKLYNLENKKIKVSIKNYKKYLNTKYLNYLKNNLISENITPSQSLNLIYPWFFSPNYQVESKDEAAIFNQKIRDKKLYHSFLFPKSGLFEDISYSLKRLLKKKKIKIKLNMPVFFNKQKNKVIFEDHKNLNKEENIKIICVPVVPLTYSIKNQKNNIPKLKPCRYFTGLIEIRNFDKVLFDNFCETIVTSDKAYGLKRISIYSDVMNINKKIYQIEFMEHSKNKDIKEQLKKISILVSKFVLSKSKHKSKVRVLGYRFLRNVFFPKEKQINDLAKETVRYFKNNKNILFPRQITWPINSNKHMIYAKNDYAKIVKKFLI